MKETPFQILVQNRDIYAYLYNHPSECPYCHKHIIPEFRSDYKTKDNLKIFSTLLCPNSECDQTFVAEYIIYDKAKYYYSRLNQYNVSLESFSEEIESISKQFVSIYNQAYFAEQNGLFEICGVGFRKALEFLIKDYLIFNLPDKGEDIKKSTIANCIKTYIEDARLKSTASRAIWLGNDHTHYEKRWENKDLEDLKTLIKLTVNWIESELLTKKFNESM
ncbi:hypothetical protein [Myroides sp. DW712]|uniref:hypothetical protein n=1 Tax=Myroides sp. DW712 TaxID=3389800 RepID=UPI00397E7658